MARADALISRRATQVAEAADECRFRLIGALSTGLWLAFAYEEQALMPAVGFAMKRSAIAGAICERPSETIKGRMRLGLEKMRHALGAGQVSLVELCRCFEILSPPQRRSRGSLGITQVSA